MKNKIASYIKRINKPVAVTAVVLAAALLVGAVSAVVYVSFGDKRLLDTKKVLSDGERSVAQVVADQVETLDGSAADDYSRPVYTFLPKGTIDYCADNDIVSYDDEGAVRYRRLNCGSRVYASDRYGNENIRIMKGTLPESNVVELISSKISDRHTVMTFGVAWKAPFKVEYLPQIYNNPDVKGKRPDYSIQSAEFTYVDITFSYAASGSGNVDLSSNPLFDSMEWLKSEDNYKLRLHLRKKGKLYGFGAEYNDNGQLIFKFLNPANVEKSNNEYGYSLKGRVIMLDAGHGGDDPGAVGSKEEFTEARLNLSLANILKDELKKTGAKVIMTRTEDKEITLAERTAAMRSAMPDIFVSIHRNSSESDTAEGFDSYYFYPFSKNLADELFNKASEVLAPRKVNYYPFYVTRVTECPAVLTENGFVSNPDELENLTRDDYNTRIAKSLAAGIVNYFAAMSE